MVERRWYAYGITMDRMANVHHRRDPLPIHRMAVAAFAALVTVASLPARASASLEGFFQTQVVESQERALVLWQSTQWMPMRLGASLAGFVAWEHSFEAWRDYPVSLNEKGPPEHVGQGNQFEPLLDMGRETWRLWSAENRLRWLILRDTALGLGSLSAGVGMIGALALVLAGRHGIASKNLSRASRLPVIPGQPLDFRHPRADPKSTRLYEQAETLRFLSPFVEDIVACFAASPDHPASLADHLNVPGGLTEHTARTIDVMATLANGRPEDERRLCLVMALAHDLGKLLAYEKDAGVWIDRRLPHDRLSGLMIAGLPAFYREVSPAHREALLCALRYYHNPEEIPTSTPPLGSVLFDLMHKADAIAHGQETALGQQQVEGVKPHLWEAFCAAVPGLNINRHQGGYPEGFTSGEIVFVLEHALREKTLDRLPLALKEKLPIRRPLGKLHPAWPLFVEMLREKHLLLDSVQTRKANQSALFNINASGVTYKCVVALSLPAVTQLAPQAVTSWMQCQPYEIKLTGARNA